MSLRECTRPNWSHWRTLLLMVLGLAAIVALWLFGAVFVRGYVFH
jgi:hypothetical protein